MSQKNACFLVIGNEVLSGRTKDANTQVLAKALNERGIRLLEVRVIPDIEDHIIRTVRECKASFDIVFTSGGIGPTHDDITTQCIAKAMGVPLILDEPSSKALEEHLGKERFNKACQKMAYLPQGATPIENKVSIAPGFSIENVHVMAGVPSIFAYMVSWLVPQLEAGVPLSSKSWHAPGLKEGQFADDLEALQHQFPSIDIGSYPYQLPDGVKGVALVAKGYDAQVVNDAAHTLHDLIVAYGQKPISGDPV
ncbi:competence/damage-inducible protein A [Swingsia samuiensis]|uniref:Competence/damage-inducible protein A n=1 Tax=Swingsia samuiensis TaxID=1293412 RepID=A0A4Y6UM82_9PROT|nr:competence/damage-inducible protein A [Swingsia samuiensis]QDH17506.1 competence/damage-inducible protein A [Swingsia samuiensis]